MNKNQALDTLQDFAPDLAAERAERLLERHAQSITLAGAPQRFYDPYAAAAAYLMHPSTLRARTEGSVSETYLDPSALLDYLRAESLRLRASWPVDEARAGSVGAFDLKLDITGWGN